jgi:exonuclease SbcD
MGTKVALVADSHFDQHSRFDECIRLHDWIADDAAARGVTLTLHAGDVYERKSTPLERQAAAAWFQRMADLGSVFVARGNHDALDDLPLLERLETRHAIRVFERAGVLPIGPTFGDGAIAVLGWPQRGHLHAALAGAGMSHELVEAAAGDALRAVLRGLGGQLALHGGPKLLLAHAMVRGSMTSTGQPLVGCDFEIGLDDLELANADAYLLGHIHKGQAWKIGDAPCIYPGSPRRTAFGEIEAKGYVVLELDEHGLIGWEFVEAPATPMVQVDATWFADGGNGGIMTPGGWRATLDQVRGAEVRLRYSVPADRREQARAQGAELVEQMLRAGAISVKVEEEVLAETRARAPEVAAAATLADKLLALWELKQFEPGSRLDALLGKASALEEAHRHAA